MQRVVRVTFTGHRPEKIVIPEKLIIDRVIDALNKLEATWTYSGLAAGFDLLAVRASWLADVPFTAARPWMTHGPRRGWESRYEWAMERAAQVIETDQATKYPGPWVYEVRNRWMVDNSDLVLAFWDGTPGGTRNCIDYAKSQNKRIEYLDVTV